MPKVLVLKAEYRKGGKIYAEHAARYEWDDKFAPKCPCEACKEEAHRKANSPFRKLSSAQRYWFIGN